jgi:small subunit ribosomal protein S6
MAAAKVVKVNQYEGMFLFGSGAAAELDATIKIVRTLIEKHGGEVLVVKKWDERKLAYEILKQKRGLYIVAYFKAPSAAIAAIERDVNLGDTILRVLITHAEHLNVDEMNAVEPQPIQPREERNPWDRPGFNNDRPPRRDDRDDRGPREDRAPRDDRAPRAPRRDDVPAEANKD